MSLSINKLLINVILVYPKADKLAKLFFWSLFIQMLSIFAGIVIIMFNVSSEVILFKIIIIILWFYTNFVVGEISLSNSE